MRAPHRVPDDKERRARGDELLDEVGEVEHVVDEVVVAARGDPRAVAEAAHVGREDAKPLRRQRRSDEVPGRGGVHVSVDQENRGPGHRAVGRPLEDVVLEAVGENLERVGHAS